MFTMAPLFGDIELVVIERLRLAFPSYIVADEVPQNMKTKGNKIITVTSVGGADIGDIRGREVLAIRVWDTDKASAASTARLVEYTMKDHSRVACLPIIQVTTTMKPQDFSEDDGFMYRMTITLTVRGE